MAQSPNVIPFEVPKLGAIGFRMDEQKRTEREKREREVRKQKEDLYEGVSTIPVSFGGREAIQLAVNETLNYFKMYESGNKEAWDLALETQNRALNGMRGASAIIKNAQEIQRSVYNNRNDFEDDDATLSQKNDNIYNKSYTIDELSNPEFLTNHLIENSPLPKVEMPSYMDISGSLSKLPINYKGMGTFVTRNADGTETFDRAAAKNQIMTPLISFALQDTEFMEAALLYSDHLNGRLDGINNKYNNEYRNNVVNRIQSNPQQAQDAIKDYADAVLDIYQSGLDTRARQQKEPTTQTNKPTQAELDSQDILGNAKEIGNGKYDVNVEGRGIKVNVEAVTLKDGVPTKEMKPTEIHSFEVGKKDEDYVVYYIDQDGNKKEWARGIKAKNFVRSKIKPNVLDGMLGGGQTTAPKAQPKDAPKEQDEFSEFKRK